MSAIRADAVHMNLRFQPFSPEAKELIYNIAKEVWIESGKRANAPTRGFAKAVGSIVAALLRGAKRNYGYVYRQMGRDTFKGEEIGYRTFKETIDGLASLAFIKVVRGTGGGNLIGTATRFRATDRLLTLVSDAGVDLGNWRHHFQSLPRPAAVNEPLVLKRSATSAHGKKKPGAIMPFDPALPKPTALAQRVNELNAYFATVRIEPDDAHYAFRRVFNQGETADFDWDKGGRLISLGDSYQQMPQKDRSLIRLNDEQTVEIDLRASHLTILHAVQGASFDPAVDPYVVPGLPRSIVKAWVTMTLGYDKFQTRWSKDNKDKYEAGSGGNLQKNYPIRDVRETVLDCLPILKNWPDSEIRWGDLQYLESCAVIDAVYELATKHGIPALPVHDSIIVPASQHAIASEILRKTFQEQTGVVPVLTAK